MLPTLDSIPAVVLQRIYRNMIIQRNINSLIKGLTTENSQNQKGETKQDLITHLRSVFIKSYKWEFTTWLAHEASCEELEQLFNNYADDLHLSDLYLSFLYARVPEALLIDKSRIIDKECAQELMQFIFNATENKWNKYENNYTLSGAISKNTVAHPLFDLSNKIKKLPMQEKKAWVKLFYEVLVEEKRGMADNYIVLHHAQARSYGFMMDMYNAVVNIMGYQVPADYKFFRCFSQENLSKQLKGDIDRYNESKIASIKQNPHRERADLLFANIGIDANCEKAGSCSIRYFMYNDNVHLEYVNKALPFEALGLGKVYTHFRVRIDKLYNQYNQLHSTGRWITISVPTSKEQQLMYLAQAGGKGREIGNYRDECYKTINDLRTAFTQRTRYFTLDNLWKTTEVVVMLKTLFPDDGVKVKVHEMGMYAPDNSEIRQEYLSYIQDLETLISDMKAYIEEHQLPRARRWFFF